LVVDLFKQPPDFQFCLKEFHKSLLQEVALQLPVVAGSSLRRKSAELQVWKAPHLEE
jgi:hypothetical protein